MRLTVHLFCSSALYLVHFIHSVSSEHVVFHYNDTYEYNVEYPIRVSKSNEYILAFNGVGLSYSPPARVTVASATANRTYPVFITARQQKGVSSWQLPMIVRTSSAVEEFPRISRTLCPHNNLMRDDDLCEGSSGNVPIIHLSTSSPEDIEVQILVQPEVDFYLPLNAPTNLTISPSEPKYYFFSFQQDNNRSLDLETLVARRKHLCMDDLTPRESSKLQEYIRDRERSELHIQKKEQSEWFSLPKSVLVMIDSDSDVCALISIQNFSCPVFDTEADVLYEGYYLTMTRRGGITLTQDMYPNGFYIVFIVKSSDEDCAGEEQSYSNQTSSIFAYFGFTDGDNDTKDLKVTTAEGREKFFSVTIVETISYKEYAEGAGLAAAVFLGFYLVYLAVVLARAARMRIRRAAQHASQPTEAARAAETAQRARAAEAGAAETADSILEAVVRRRTHWGVSYTGSLRASTQYLISPSDRQQEAAELGSPSNLRLCVADLCKKRPSVLRARSNLYLWNVLTVATFYTLPVLQLALTYQTLYNQSGNQDLCYYNFMCANPLLALSDFNHVFSNVGYVALGLLFLVEVYRRHRRHAAAPPAQQELGIPQHFGMLYAMGVALASEGLLSAAYHVCPNSLNFQFDTSFMYVTSVLSMVKLYQSRHPDINARAHATFGVLALIIFIGLIGILKANLIFWSLFTAAHIVTCFVLTFQIYYLGRFEWGWVGKCPGAVRREGLRAATPTYCARMLLLLLANLANWALAAYGLWQHQRDFASHLLLVLLGNLFLYTVFYVCMKCAHGEGFRTHTLAFLALAFLAWLPAGYLFMHRSTNWVLSPAQSRRYNEPCWLLMYDSHDLWHFASAVAMFLSFNMYLTMDDNLARTPRHLIHVF